MLEFLYKHNTLITHSIEALAAVIGVFCLKKYKDTAAFIFIFILIYLFFVDLLGMYPQFYNDFDFLKPIESSVFRKNNWWFTVFFDVIAIVLFSVLFQKILKNSIYKSILKYKSIFYFLISVCLITSQLETLFKSSFPILYILQTIIILTCSIFYFVEVVKSESLLIFYKSLYFYISIAIFIWWLVVTPLVFFDVYYTLEDRSFIVLKRGIYIFANLFMYATFAIGLIVSTPEKE